MIEFNESLRQHKSVLTRFCGLAGSILIAMAVVMTAAVPAEAACDVASFTAPADTTIVSAEAFATPVPYCRVDGYVTTTNPGPNRVRFMMALPDSFNGRYLFTAQGGAAGFVPDPTEEHLRLGYAIASTDKGVTATHLFDFSFRSNEAQSLDWSHRGAHVAAVATQALARAYYEKPERYRYVAGCSGGAACRVHSGGHHLEGAQRIDL